MNDKMGRSDNPLQYRRNAISITPDSVRSVEDQTIDNHMIHTPFTHDDKLRVMSLSDETTDPRLKKNVPKFSLNADEAGNSGGLSSRLTQAQINGMRSTVAFVYRAFKLNIF